MFVPKEQLRNTVASLTRALTDAQLQRTQALASYESVRDRAAAEHARLEDEKQELAVAVQREIEAADRSLKRAMEFSKTTDSAMEAARQLVEERDAAIRLRGAAENKCRELQKSLAYAKAQVQAQAVSIQRVAADLAEAVRERDGLKEHHDALQSGHGKSGDRVRQLAGELAAVKRQLISEGDEWESMYNGVCDAKRELQASLDWWIAEANRRGNFILGMSPADTEWPRVIAHDPESLSDHLVNTSVTVRPDKARLHGSSKCDEMDPHDACAEFQVAQVSPEMIAIVTGDPAPTAKDKS